MGKITGTVTLMEVNTGTLRTVRITPFTVADETPWVDVVDQAVERVVDGAPGQPKFKTAEGEDWEVYDDHLDEVEAAPIATLVCSDCGQVYYAGDTCRHPHGSL